MITHEFALFLVELNDLLSDNKIECMYAYSFSLSYLINLYPEN